jgi:hypothetical protein
MAFGFYTVLDGLFGWPWDDPRVSYGFKEMYCDALPYKHDGGMLKVGTVAYSPRLTIYKTLVDVLQVREGVCVILTAPDVANYIPRPAIYGWL